MLKKEREIIIKEGLQLHMKLKKKCEAGINFVGGGNG